MATSIWRTPRPLSELLFERHGAFNVFQLLHLLQWKARRQAHRATADDPAEREVRFRADLSGAFPGCEITGLARVRPQPPGGDAPRYQRRRAQETVELTTPNFCVAAGIGPLPEPYLDWLRDLKRLREPAMAEFFDLFNQRINALRHKLKAAHSPGLNHAPPEETPQAFYLACFMGMGQPELELARRIPLPPRALFGLAGLLANQRRSSAAVRSVLQVFLGVEVTIQELVGAWQPLEDDDLSALGRVNHVLGGSAVLGRQVWAQQARIRVTVAPVDWNRFVELLPGGPGHEGLVALLRLLLDRLCDCEVRLQVLWDRVPPARLAGAGDGQGHGLRLGQTAWLKRTPRDGRKRRAPAAPGPDRTASASYLVRAFSGAGSEREAA
jgi:type VI secretion system protein ImpH